MQCVVSTPLTVFLKLQTPRNVPFVLGGSVIPSFALCALERDIFLHFLSASSFKNLLLDSFSCLLTPTSYSTIWAMVPAPTVCPPSRMAKRSPFSMAMGVISCTSTETLSPGMTISVPPSSSTEPVTSVVRK